MAILRRELQGRSAVANLFDAVCETSADLELEEPARWVEGSMMLCLNTDTGGAATVYVKLADGTWSEVAQG